MHKRWFGALKRGFGWYPATWQGWAIFVLYVVVVVWDFLRIYGITHSISGSLLPFLPEFLIFTVILAFICYFTGEKPKF